MKITHLLAGLALSASTLTLTAQLAEPAPSERPGRQDAVAEQTPHDTAEVLTDEQKARVKAILSRFNTNDLTAVTARAIHEAFRQEGLRGGPATAETIRAAGFDPDRLRELAPPPGRQEDVNDAPQTDIDQSSAGTSHGLALRSPAVADGGALPVEFTGDGTSATLPLEWSGAPGETKSFAVIMHHVDPQGKTKWYWILYNLPAGTTALPKNVSGIGTTGNNSINGSAGYAPPHSKGPGTKTYIYTLYALSAPVKLDLPPERVSRQALLTAMQDSILATAELKVVYTRSGLVSTKAAEQTTQPPASPPR